MNELMELLGLPRPEAQRMASEAGVIGERPLRVRRPDLCRDAWSGLYGMEETMFLLDREDRRTLLISISTMLKEGMK